MPTRPEVDKAEGKAEANSHEAEAEADQNCSIFQPNFAFWPNFLHKTEIFGRFLMEIQKLRLKTALTWELY